jgi:hypothetical protein
VCLELILTSARANSRFRKMRLARLSLGVVLHSEV